MMNTIQTQINTNTWLKGTWEEYIDLCTNQNYKQNKFYYYNHKIRIETPPLEKNHASDHSFINYSTFLYATLKEIPLNGKDCLKLPIVLLLMINDKNGYFMKT